MRNAVGLMDLSTSPNSSSRARTRSALSRAHLRQPHPEPRRRHRAGPYADRAGFIESELTITRLGWIASSCCRPPPPSSRTRTAAAGPAVGRASASSTNVTEAYGVLVLAGPRSREVLEALTEADLGNTAFPWLTGRIIRWRGSRACGRCGSTMSASSARSCMCPMAAMPSVFDALMREGERHGIKLFGTYAMNSLRMEKAYRAWGAELTNEVTCSRARWSDSSIRQRISSAGRQRSNRSRRTAHPARLSRGRRHRFRLPRQ